jgi:hypothetical protein
MTLIIFVCIEGKLLSIMMDNVEKMGERVGRRWGI